MNQEYKLDRTAFKAMEVNEADDAMQDYKNYSWKERLRISAYLTSVAYNYNLNTPPAIDRTAFEALTVFHE